MCMSCFLKYTNAPVINERVVAAYRRISERSDEASSSSLLHVIVGDMNVDDHLFDRNRDDLGWHMTYDQSEGWERAIYDDLAALSESERATAVAMEWGYISPTGELRPDLRPLPVENPGKSGEDEQHSSDVRS